LLAPEVRESGEREQEQLACAGIEEALAATCGVRERAGATNRRAAAGITPWRRSH
jgi:hypothetical protein